MLCGAFQYLKIELRGNSSIVVCKRATMSGRSVQRRYATSGLAAGHFGDQGRFGMDRGLQVRVEYLVAKERSAMGIMLLVHNRSVGLDSARWMSYVMGLREQIRIARLKQT